MGDNKVRKKEGSQNTLVILLALLIIIIIGLIIGIALVKILRDGSLAGSDDTESDEDVDYVAEVDSITNEIEEKLKGAETSEEKAALHMERAGRLSNIVSGFDEGVEINEIVLRDDVDVWSTICSDAYEAEKLNPSSNTAMMIFDCESERENQELANKYLEIATERAKTDGQGGG